ncbi:bifunctional 3-(3-hydroxy-phenyl)propionate/3-hydroxycinnamic acid hydroxylase [Bradyrhizobium sp. U87765 SZCCT0131]|uniref:bifunctional 3-(3-hydroxy-phenyl)propionate/3-hydroxycinnamic acid hydroxylase MhpA n=1 Tax=unclassified Bradyrhizobium TaxID=2631580 RepID=UPI001BA4927B|nr:bifunctional 3-(3-hydroxy-phenyl)propionate/3-hydroxycinnamic acid hydroxylase [Bradyrhizobium sp. U87765 SZCCT0131]MBR1260484.1 bifunctional 3-(3-hydroxy-phenyl)propionate/3-hydroxycinnamic acid hydroxylase [Bradyrhizobium sp. U87765 SZCCT0134]MBR1304068.1 bifunctional 3-(3-hydroxy-phenyl)propionate/3-hydroxycinnamic acid hydroxylase [Bradyrhizobium sp. U87765 SZCCT0110]MBR1319674.1 bifunctional 3-(3-hydroxy-phenyl)propionate/3-hydroxycinnamic acid hydroxylase [Bradyrhizobium sp. U87765 SZCC
MNNSSARADVIAERRNVAIIGCGPTGLAAAALIGKAGHHVIVIERWPEPYGLPRLSHIDGETARLVQSAGDIDHALRDALAIDNYHYLDADGNILIDLDWKGTQCGFPAHISIFQPEIEEAMDRRARSQPNVEVLRGWEAVAIAVATDRVNVTVQPWAASWNTTADSPPRQRLFEVDYVIGADGAHSFTRRALGIERVQFGHHERWLNLDSEYVRDLGDRFAVTSIYCDPARAHMYMPVGKSRVRFEMRVLPGEDTAYWEDLGNGLQWLAAQHGIGLDDVKPIRNVVYTFDPAMTAQWRRGRGLLAGDAAHTMMPYMGQGACSGIRDSANLAWKLDLVLTGLCSECLLDSYEQERRPHVAAITETSTFLGMVANEDDPVKVATRNAMLRSGQVPPLPSFPKIEAGVVHVEEDGSLLPTTGAPTPQGIVRHAGVEGRLDDVFGSGFLIVSREDPTPHLDPAMRVFLDRLGCGIAVIGEQASGAHAAEDVDGAQSDYLRAHGMAAYLRRPDFIAFGSVSALDQLPALLRSLRRSLCWCADDGMISSSGHRA